MAGRVVSTYMDLCGLVPTRGAAAADIQEWSEREAKVGSVCVELVSGKLLWSPGMEYLLGEAGQGDFDRALSVFVAVDRRRLIKAIDRALASGTPWDYSLCAGSRDGDELRRLRCRGEVVIDKGKRTLWLLFQDVTTEAAVLDKVAQLTKLASIGEMASGIVHEINNPLTIVKGHADSLLRRLANDGEKGGFYEAAAQSILSGTKRIFDIVGSLSSHARADLNPSEKFQVHAIIEESLRLLAPIYARYGIAFEVKLAATDAEVEGQVGRFQQALMNLWANARDALKDRAKKQITIETANAADGRLVIKVTDNGCGIDPSLQKKIFDKFYTSKARGEGTGLGLSLSAGFVSEMRGTIEVASEPEFGTTFTLTFPMAETAAKKISGFSAQLRSQRVLVVDDNETLTDVMRAGLEKVGLEVVTAPDGNKAIIECKQRHFDILISDLRLPGLSGVDLIRALERTNMLPRQVYVMTGGHVTDYPIDDRNYLRGVCSGFFQKPFSLAEVSECLVGKKSA